MRTMTSFTNCLQMFLGEALHCKECMGHGIRGSRPLPSDRSSTSPELALSTCSATSICATIARLATGGVLRTARITICIIMMVLTFTITPNQEGLLEYRKCKYHHYY